jgi:hypothetical protein
LGSSVPELQPSPPPPRREKAHSKEPGFKVSIFMREGLLYNTGPLDETI